MAEQKTFWQRARNFAIWVLAIYACLIIFDFIYVKVTGQTPQQTLTVVTFSNVTASSLLDGCDLTPNPCIDNRSQFLKQSSTSSYRAISSGVGSWSVDMQWADNSPAGPWTSFGSTAQVTQASASGIGYGIGPSSIQKPYHDYIRFVMTGNVIILNYSGTRQFWWLPSIASVAFPITATQGGTVGAFVVDQLYATPALGCTAATSAGISLVFTTTWASVPTQSMNCSLQFFGGGKIVMAANATLTPTSTILAPAGQQIFDISASGSAVNLTGAKLNSTLPAPWFGVVCDGATSNARSIPGAQAAMGNNSNINFPDGDCRVPQIRAYSGQRIIGAGGSSQFVSGQTTFTYTGTAGTPMITNNTGGQITGFFILDIAIDGGGLAQPLAYWLGIQDGGIIGSAMSGPQAGGDAVIVDSSTGVSYRNTFQGNKCDTVPGSCFILQNGANANFIEKNFIINQTATADTYGIKVLSASANNVIGPNDIESFTVSPSGSVTGTAIYLDAPGNILVPGGRIEEVLNGIVITSNGGSTTISCGNIFTTSVTNPITVLDPFTAHTNQICYQHAGTGDTSIYSSWLHNEITSFSGGSTVDYTLFPQTNTSNLLWRFDLGMNTSGNHRFEWWDNNARSAYVDMKTGAWVGTGNLYGSIYLTSIGLSGDSANAASWLNVAGLAVNVKNNSTITTVDIDPVLQTGNAITGSSLNSGGAAYAVNDTGILVGPASTIATYIVNTVDGSGAVLTYSITAAGGGYIVRDGYLTAQGGAQPGKGFGLTINITSVSTSTADAAVSIFGSMTGSGKRKANVAGYLQSTGTKFTVTGCSAGTTLGGSIAGSFLSGSSATCTFVITLAGATGTSATNGWACHASDIATGTVLAQSASSTTTCSVTGATTSGDKIVFSGMAF